MRILFHCLFLTASLDEWVACTGSASDVTASLDEWVACTGSASDVHILTQCRCACLEWSLLFLVNNTAVKIYDLILDQLLNYLLHVLSFSIHRVFQ
jgi:hypothetical protein